MITQQEGKDGKKIKQVFCLPKINSNISNNDIITAIHILSDMYNNAESEEAKDTIWKLRNEYINIIYYCPLCNKKK